MVDTSQGTDYFSEATYTCSEGYVLIGVTSRTCNAVGQWSGLPPECESKKQNHCLFPSTKIILIYTLKSREHRQNVMHFITFMLYSLYTTYH